MTGSGRKLAVLYPPAPLPAQHRVSSPIKASDTNALHRSMDDDNNRRRRQNEPPIQHTNTRYHQTVQNPAQQQAHRTMAGPSSERYRPAPLNTSPQGAARPGMSGGSAGYGGYYQEPSSTGFAPAAGLHPNTMGYQQPATSYGQDARQTQNFASPYNPNMMYNVPQAATQNAVYDTGSFELRQPAAPQMMPTDSTMAAAPYFSSEPTNAAAASAMQQQQPSSAQAAAVYQQGSADRNTMLNYPSNMAGMQTMGAQATTAAPEVTMEESSEYPGGADLNQAYTQYQDALKEIYKNIRDGALVSASESLLSVSEWLLSHVHELGKEPPLLPCQSKKRRQGEEKARRRRKSRGAKQTLYIT